MHLVDNPIQLSSETKNINQIDKIISSIFERYNIPEELFGNVLIALTEAVNNAILHGNNCNSLKKVLISHCFVENKTLSFSVSDEGDGFDPNALPDPTDPINIEKIGGRGVFLMRQLSDNLIFNDNGRNVVIEFKLGNQNAKN